MKRVLCSREDCSKVRAHWDRPDVQRGPQYIVVEDDYVGPAYCSITCALLDGALKEDIRGGNPSSSTSHTTPEGTGSK